MEFKEKSDIILKVLHDYESGRFKMEACKNCYIPQNTVMTPEDSIDAYAEEILERINRTQG